MLVILRWADVFGVTKHTFDLNLKPIENVWMLHQFKKKQCCILRFMNLCNANRSNAFSGMLAKVLIIDFRAAYRCFLKCHNVHLLPRAVD